MSVRGDGTTGWPFRKIYLQVVYISSDNSDTPPIQRIKDLDIKSEAIKYSKKKIQAKFYI